MKDDTPPTITSLPNETLRPILLDVARSHTIPTEFRRKHVALLQLGLVCHRWNDIIRSEPRIWTECSVSFPSHSGLTRRAEREADQAMVDALEGFYSRSGSDIGLIFECHFKRTSSQQAVFRLNRLLVSMAHRWTRMELDSQESLSGSYSASWFYPFLNLAIKEKDRLGYSPFSNVGSLKMTIPPSDYHRSQTWGTGDWRDVQVVSLPLCLPFPNLTKLCLKFAANIRGVQKLYQMLAFKHLTALQFSVSSYDNTDIVLQDLLSPLPMLKHLDIQGVEPDTSGLPFTHYRSKSLTTRNGPYHRYSGLSLPSLQRLSVGHAQYPSDVALSSLSALLSNTPNQLRMLGLDTDPLNEMDIYHLLTDLPMLEELVLRVPFNGKWETMEGHTFRKLLEHSSDSVRMLLPRLKEVILHMDRKVEEDDRDPAYRRAEFAGFCAFRDAFIDFVEDPRRGLAENEMDIAQEADNLSALIEEDPSRLAPVPAWAGPLEIAHFDYAESDDYYAGVVYHRGRDYTEPVSFWDNEFM